MTTTITTHDQDEARPAERLPRRLTGTRPATDVASYGDVPWYRKAEFILFPLLMPLLIVVAITGDIFFQATRTTRKYSDARVWRYTVVPKAFFVAVNALFLAMLFSLFV